MIVEEWRSQDKIARSTICIHMAENVYFNMMKEMSTYALWEKLQVVYEKKSSSSKLILIRQLFNMKMKETDPVTSHIITFSLVLSELSSQGINFEEEVKALALLSSLPARDRHREDRQRSKSRNSRLSVFCTHCRKIGHDVSDSWSIKRRENGRRFKRNKASISNKLLVRVSRKHLVLHVSI